MSLVRLRNISVGFGGPAILGDIDFSVDKGERVALVGRNGTGKSTLLKLIAGQFKAESGSIEYRQSIKIAMLDQEVSLDLEGTIFDIIAHGLGDVSQLLADYHRVSHQIAVQFDEKTMSELERLQHEIEVADAWQSSQQVETIISKMQLDGDVDFNSLSGGMKRRVLLARALVVEPDVLLLDEPTNHLDIEAIQWLEEQVFNFNGALLFITHDRAFMKKLSTRIVELDRGVLTSYSGDYETFLRRKQENLDAEEVANAKFDKKLAQEEVWIRQGIKARRTRNEGRVRDLLKLREQRQQRRNHVGKVNMKISSAEKSGKIIAEVSNVNFSYDDKPVISDFNTVLMRGDKVGIIGPNGVGKTTLLKVLLGELQPDTGTVKLGTKQHVAYFDQLRGALNLDETVIDNVSQGRERIEVNGQEKHIIGYLQEFLFAPDRARQPVSALSGGERNRLLLAKLFSKPANILVLDEPTNDLDIETLELLEELVLDYKGTVLLVSHDREFINNVVTSSLVFENNTVNEYVGGYDDWLRQRQFGDKRKATKLSGAILKEKPKKNTGKLSYKDQRELDALPGKIESLDGLINDLHNLMNSPEFYQKEKNEIVDVQEKLKQAEKDLEICYLRWESLEEDE